MLKSKKKDVFESIGLVCGLLLGLVLLIAVMIEDVELMKVAGSLLMVLGFVAILVEGYLNRKKIRIKAVKEGKELYKRSEKWVKEFRKNSSSGEALIIWLIGATKLFYTLMNLMLLYISFNFGKTGLSIAWKVMSDYFVRSGMDPIKVESMKNNVLVSCYSMGFTLFLLSATVSMVIWTVRREDFRFKNSSIVRTMEFLFRLTLFILDVGVLVYVFSTPDPFTLTVFWMLLLLIIAKKLSRSLTNFILNRNQKAIFQQDNDWNHLIEEAKSLYGLEDEIKYSEHNSNSDTTKNQIKTHFLVKESWKSLVVLENTIYSKAKKEPFWILEKTYRFRYTFFKFKRSLHISSSLLDSLDEESDDTNPNNPPQNNDIQKVEEQLSKNIFISPRGTITSSETLIDRLKEKGYKVKILDLDAPAEYFNPIDSLKQQIAEDYILEASINGIKTEKELEEFKESLIKYGVTSVDVDNFTTEDKFKLAKKIKRIEQERKWREEQTLPTKKDALNSLRNKESDEDFEQNFAFEYVEGRGYKLRIMDGFGDTYNPTTSCKKCAEQENNKRGEETIRTEKFNYLTSLRTEESDEELAPYDE
ncbi:hypothetical protein [Carnobacterium maltaromaticum]|uniref:hypothetical protein n=1 Tax=Carnobacterium maltaromaticum TaxID=2751 RepID=UPI00295E8991|nr:hypothetical protein [Carnobacterium maltaromaticum]